NGVAVVLSLLVAAGLVAMIKRRRYGFVLWAGLFLFASAVLIVKERYAYGAYKVLLLANLPLAYLCVAGLASITRRVAIPGGTTGRRLVAATPALLILPFNHYATGSLGPQQSPMSREPASSFRALERSTEITKGAETLVVVDDWLDN